MSISCEFDGMGFLSRMSFRKSEVSDLVMYSYSFFVCIAVFTLTPVRHCEQ